MNLIAAVALIGTIGAVIARQLLLRGPPVWAIFLVGALAMVAGGALSVGGAAQAISANLPVLVFLFALFVFAAALEQAGALEHLARWILGRTRTPASLPFALFVGFGLVSAVVLNDALVLVGVPLLLAVARRIRASPEPLLLTLAFAVTVGSVLTPFGNPQNLLVSLGSGLTAPVVTFLRYLALPTAVNLVVGGLYLRWVAGPRVAAGPPATAPLPRVKLFPRGGWTRRLVRFPALVVFPATILLIVALEVVGSFRDVTIGPPIYLLALGGAAIVLLLSPGRRPVLARVDWPILVLFAALFVVVAGALVGGVLSSFEALWPVPRPGTVSAVPAIVLSSLAGSQLVSNVPWVGLQIPLLRGLGYGAGTPLAWMALAGGSTLAGNATLVGAASNLIVVEQAERAGIRIGLRAFVRWGLPLTAITVAVVIGLLALGL
jgi:Na+/H+ antiporter NhaD/arsenite permease-like protein